MLPQRRLTWEQEKQKDPASQNVAFQAPIRGQLAPDDWYKKIVNDQATTAIFNYTIRGVANHSP